MSAINGMYTPKHSKYGRWSIDWLFPDRWSTPRHPLANQLLAIRKESGTIQAREFRNYLLWLGVYPSRIKRRMNNDLSRSNQARKISKKSTMSP